MAEVPKLRVPFEIAGDKARVVEQDSSDEIAQCVYAILATEVGSRVEEPEFGTADQTFRQGGADIEEMRAAVDRWEPRVEELLTETDFDFATLVQEVRQTVG